MAPRPNALPWLLLSALLVVLDQWTKALALQHLELHRPVPVIAGWLDWTLTYNYGAAFSFLNVAGGGQRWFFSVLAVGVSLLLMFWLARIPRRDWRQALPFALIVGGALGNLIDRLRFGYVVDFVDAYWGTHHWPAFNVADSAIVAGAIGLALFTIVLPGKPANAG
jgi:signal peptidase II